MRRSRAAFVRRPERRWVALALALTCAGPAAAAKVALLRPVHDTREIREALFRLKGELLAIDLEVVVEPRPSEGLEQTAEAHDLDALLDVIGEQAPVGVDVWLRDRATRKLTVTRVELEPSRAEAGETLAIHAIEVLRSALLSVERPLPARPAAPPAELDRPVRPQAPRSRGLGLELGATVLAGVDGVAPAILPLVRLDWALGPRIVLNATAAGLGTHATIDPPAGSVDVAQQFGLFGLCLCPQPAAGVAPLAGLSAGFLRTAVEGRARLPDISHRAQSWSFLLDASAGASLALSPRYFMTLSGHVQLAAPYVAIRVLDAVVATSGRPNLLLTVTLGGWR